jgi:hypothetical protein
MISPSSESDVKLTEKEKEKLMHDFSYGFAKALHNEPALRSYIKNEAVKQIDGDYDIFYLLSKGDKVDDKNTLHDLLTKYSVESKSMAIISSSFLNLNIKVLGLDKPVENWDTQSYVPIVAVRSYDGDVETITAYNGQGAKVLLDSHKQPDKLTVVVEESERIHIKSYESLVKDWNESILKILPYTVEEVSATKPPVAAKQTGRANEQYNRVIYPAWWTNTACPRQSAEAAIQNRNVLHKITISQSGFEKASDNWTEGRLDIRARLLTVRGDSKALDELDLFTEVYKEIQAPNYDRNGRFIGYYTIYGYDAQKTFDGIMGQWDATLNGNTWKLSFIDMDPGDQTTTIKESFTSSFEYGIKTTDSNKSLIGFNADYRGSQEGSYEYVFKNEDDPMGDQFIYYCNKFGPTQIYNTGNIIFTIAPMQ